MTTIQQAVTKAVRLTTRHREFTQMWFIAREFERNPNTWISAKNMNTRWVTEYLMHECEKRNIPLDLYSIYNSDIDIPGDIQRALRTFNTTYQGTNVLKNEIRDSEPHYLYDANAVFQNVIRPPRMFNSEVIQKVKERNENKCEACGDTTERMCADHGRAWSKYYLENPNISTIGNCVWLCERCNIIKKDRSGYHIVRKCICSLEKWKLIYDRISSNGFPMNDEEKAEYLRLLN